MQLAPTVVLLSYLFEPSVWPLPVSPLLNWTFQTLFYSLLFLPYGAALTLYMSRPGDQRGDPAGQRRDVSPRRLYRRLLPWIPIAYLVAGPLIVEFALSRFTGSDPQVLPVLLGICLASIPVLALLAVTARHTPSLR
jgi:hypothetical protein